MAVKKEKNINSNYDEPEIPIYVDRMFKEKSKQNVLKKFKEGKARIERRAMLLAILVLLIAYFILPVSKVNAISIHGNHNLNESYIKELSGLSLNSRLFLSIPQMISAKLEQNPFIDQAEVTWKQDNVIDISISEKKAIGYRYDKDSPEVLFADGTSTELTSDYLDIIAKVPLITGFQGEELTNKLCKAFENVEEKVIEQISEINEYSLSYESSALKVLMRTGGYFISSFENLTSINYYNEYYSDMTNKSYCIFAVDQTSTASAAAYSAACPWSDSNSTTEYWMDENGNVITNSEGQQVVKNYYTDSEGNRALDGNGNAIPIPIDENGHEVIDENFQENYANGYYASGSLVYPEETDEDYSEDGE